MCYSGYIVSKTAHIFSFLSGICVGHLFIVVTEHKRKGIFGHTISDVSLRSKESKERREERGKEEHTSILLRL